MSAKTLPIVYFMKDITPENLVRIYDLLGRPLNGRVAVKISTGEPGGHNFLSPMLIASLVGHVKGTIVECNTAYEGKRNTTDAHMEAIKQHGFLDIAACDIMDADGDMPIPVKGGKHLMSNRVGTHLDNYDSFLILSHFKGHAMAGFGGALKNVAIGMASSKGKIMVHTGGKSLEPKDIFTADKTLFLESMADAVKSVLDHKGWDNFLYINVANNLSVDCDCDAHPADPCMADIGIFASTDPVAVDQACLDAVYESDDPGRSQLIDRITSRTGMTTMEAAYFLGLGNVAYTLKRVN